MKCDHCGTINVDEANYCRGCGKLLNNDLERTNSNVPANENRKNEDKKSPLKDTESKLEKLSYGIIVLALSLILGSFLPFIYSNYISSKGELSLTLIELLPELDSYSTTNKKSMSGAELGAILILVFSVIGVISAVKRKPLLNIVLLCIPLCVWLIGDTVSEWQAYRDFKLDAGGWLYCVVPIIICCLSIKQYSLQKNIKELALYYKANGIMEYTSKDFCVCPLCNQFEFIRDAGYCRNCDFEGSYKSVKDINYIILVCVLENLIAVLFAINSNWIEIFSMTHMGNSTIEKIHSLDTTMCLIYWINLVFWLVPGIAARELNKNTFLYFSVPYVIMNIIVICHSFLLANILPYRYSQGCTLFGWVMIIGCISEIIVTIKKWKKAKPFFCHKYGSKEK